MIAVDHSYQMSHHLHDLVQRRRLSIKSWKPSIDFDFPCQVTLGAAIQQPLLQIMQTMALGE
eukprot:1691574-Rhodomonas_salina.1